MLIYFNFEQHNGAHGNFHVQKTVIYRHCSRVATWESLRDTWYNDKHYTTVGPWHVRVTARPIDHVVQIIN